MLFKKETVFKLGIIVGFGLPLFLALSNMLTGTMSFWFDPARDFLLALDNLRKPTFIGPPTGGIPGLFYGPYWIWLLSLGLLISKNPVVVTILVLTLPYVILFPLLLFRFQKTLGKGSWLVLWLLFFLSYRSYMLSPWNPNLSPLLFLFLVYLLLDLSPKKKLKIFFSGFVAGLIVNFHLSFGMAVVIGSFFSLTFIFWKKQLKTKLSVYFLFASGIFLSLLPFFIFELRHGFNQINLVIKTVREAVLYHISPTGNTGLTQKQIVDEVVGRFGKLLGIDGFAIGISYGLLLFCLLLFFFWVLKKPNFLRKEEKNLALVIFSIGVTTVVLYLVSRNPIWAYHFIGLEIVFLLFIGLLLKKSRFLLLVVSFWLLFLYFIDLSKLFRPGENPYAVSSLKTKRLIIDRIYDNAKGEPFSIFIYSPAIYTYDYDYILLWLGKDEYRYLPQREIIIGNPVYLVIPETSQAIRDDFINYRTPNSQFQTAAVWEIDDGTQILKREPLSYSPLK